MERNSSHSNSIFLLSLFVLFFSTILEASSLDEVSKFFSGCRKEAGLTVKGKRVIDFTKLSGGKASSRTCVYDVKCSLPKKNIIFEDNLACAFDDITGCEDLDSCIANLPKRDEKAFSRAIVEPSSSKQNCNNLTQEHVLTAPHKMDPDKYTAVCIKDLVCSDASGKKNRHSFVACSPLPETKKILHSDGKEYDFDVCPKNDTCLSKQIEVKSEADFIQQLADTRKMAIINTVPHYSSPTLSTSPLKGSHQEIVVP